MIHQFIYAGPKPGLSAEAFQSYWVNFHAVDYAAKIPQIVQYLVSTRVPVDYPREAAFFQGIAEIWLRNDEEQIASMQTPEFLQGARADEPRWAAFWQTFVHDADAVTVVPPAHGEDHGYTKVYALLKRAPGSSLEEFRERLLGGHAAAVAALEGVQGHRIGFARPGAYGFGEPRFDAVDVWWFASPDAARAALGGEAMRGVEESWAGLADAGQLFTFTGQEHWVIRPGAR